jgi:DNA-binding XRE family transcriptional regulator
MKASKNAGRLVAELRKVIGKSQTQFATMIGVSKHTIISVENGRNQLSRKLAKRIEIATGADLLRSTLDNYTLDQFNQWRTNYFPSNEASARKQFDEMKTWLKVVFLAAAKSGVAGNRDRLPAIRLSLAEWLDEARHNFKLEKEIEDILEDETHDLGHEALEVSDLLRNPAKAKEQLAEHGIEFSRIKKQLKKCVGDVYLIIEDEFRMLWDPAGGPQGVLCKTRKLIPKAKYWFKSVPPGPYTISQIQKILFQPESRHSSTSPSTQGQKPS